MSQKISPTSGTVKSTHDTMWPMRWHYRCFRGALGSRKRTLAHDAELRARATPTSRIGR